jgi:hypothetical protein
VQQIISRHQKFSPSIDLSFTTPESRERPKVATFSSIIMGAAQARDKLEEMFTKFGDCQEREEGEVLPGDEALSGAVKSEQILVVGTPDWREKMVGDRQQWHELHSTIKSCTSPHHFI